MCIKTSSSLFRATLSNAFIAIIGASLLDNAVAPLGSGCPVLQEDNMIRINASLKVPSFNTILRESMWIMPRMSSRSRWRMKSDTCGFHLDQLNFNRQHDEVAAGCTVPFNVRLLKGPQSCQRQRNSRWQNNFLSGPYLLSCGTLLCRRLRDELHALKMWPLCQQLGSWVAPKSSPLRSCFLASSPCSLLQTVLLVFTELSQAALKKTLSPPSAPDFQIVRFQIPQRSTLHQIVLEA